MEHGQSRRAGPSGQLLHGAGRHAFQYGVYLLLRQIIVLIHRIVHIRIPPRDAFSPIPSAVFHQCFCQFYTVHFHDSLFFVSCCLKFFEPLFIPPLFLCAGHNQLLHNVVAAGLGGVVKRRVLTEIRIAVVCSVLQKHAHYIIVPGLGCYDQGRLPLPIALIDIGSMGQKLFRDVFVLVFGGKMQRRIPVVVPDVHIRPGFQQKLRYQQIVLHHSKVQRRHALVVCGIDVRISSRQHCLYNLALSVVAGLVKRCVAVCVSALSAFS